MWVLVEVNKSGNFDAIIGTFDTDNGVYRYLFGVATSWNMTFVQRSNTKVSTREYELWDEDNPNRVLRYRALFVDHHI